MKTLNKLRLLLLVFISVISINSISAQCNLTSNFSYVDNGNGFYTFTNTSTGNYNSSLFLYGDGTAPTDNPTHSYANNGTYQVCLLIQDTINLNCYDSICQTVVVTLAAGGCNLISSFTYSDIGNGTISFTNTSTGNFTNTFYYYGDGTYGSNSTHTYPGNGTYNVGIEVMDSSTWCYDSVYQQVTVTSSLNPCNLNALATVSNIGNGSYAVSNLSFGNYNSSLIDYGDGTVTTNPSHTYANNGTYQICLIIQDTLNPNCVDSVCQTVNVTSANGCNLLASFNTTNNGNGNYSFSNTSTGGSAPYTYSWDLGDGTNATVANIVKSYNAGTYLICLTVTDVQGCSDVYCDSVVVTSSQPCNNNTDFTFIDNGNGTVTFTNLSSGTGTNYYWSFGDGTSTYANNPTHTFTANGTYGVIVSVSNSNGSCYSCHIEFVTVTGVNNNPPCNAGFTIFPDTINPNIDFTVWNSSTPSTNYFWDFGDGNTSTLANPMYTYTSNGPFYLCLTTTDSLSGCSSTYCDSIGDAGLVFKKVGFTIGAQSTIITGIEEVNTISGINAYPNPLKGNLNIEINLTQKTQVEVFVTDLLGNTVSSIANQEMVSGNNKLTWNANPLSNGVYLLNIKTNNSLKVEKFVVNK